jgi:hypothetical protein
VSRVAEKARLVQAENLARRGDTPDRIREWAQSQGFPVGRRGRISKEVMEAYVEAHRTVIVLPPVRPRPRKVQRVERKPVVVHLDSAPLCIGRGWRLTPHVARRAKELGFEYEELLAAAVEPDVTYEQSARGDGEAICRKGDVTVGVSRPNHMIRTVLLTTTALWAHGCDRRT